MYKDLVRTSQRAPCPLIRKAKWPILYNETISLCCTKYVEHRICGNSVELPNVKREGAHTWCVQVLRSPKEAFAAAMQSWRERCEKCVCLQGDYVEK